MIPYIIIFIVIISIIGSALWSSGSILLLDYVLTPHGGIDWFAPFISPFLNILSHVFGTVVISKFFYVSILIVAAYLGVILARRIAEYFGYQRYSAILEVFGGIFMIINPFIYERMMVQPLIALGTICLGYSLYYLYFSHRIIIASVVSGFGFILMPHASYMIALIFGLYALFFVRSRRIIFQLVAAGGIILAMNLNWLMAGYIGYNNIVTSINSFSPVNLEAFRTQAIDPLNVWGTNLLLYGFWGERYDNHYASVDILSSLWYISGFCIVAIVLLGYWTLWKARMKRLFSVYIIIGCISLFFAIGIASPLTDGLALWMGQNVPFWQGYREPQKWIGILMIIEGIGFLMGLGWILNMYGKDRIVLWCIVLITSLILLIWSPGPLMGFHGQLKTTVYPPAFELFRSNLLSHRFTGRILVLPWHSYIGCDWIGRPTISNPIRGLLAPLPITSSDNIEVADILYSNSHTPETLDIEKFLQNSEISLIQKHGFTDIFWMRGCANSTHTDAFIDSLIRTNAITIQAADVTYGFYHISSGSIRQ